MNRTNLVILFSCLLTLISCSGGNDDSASPVAAAPDSARSESWRESQLALGQDVYEKACAACHDQGEGNAPAIGDQTAWSERSDLWTAVLSAHAQAGYFNMPEKGGHGELTDEQVSAAVEYMMFKTFPGMPRD
jgi:cytochrome c oxidase cbb3-type subunit 3